MADQFRQRTSTQKELLLSSISESDLQVYQRLGKMISDEISLWKVSICFGVNRSPLRNILQRKPVSKYILKKLHVQLEKGVDPDLGFFQTPIAKRLLSIYRSYQEKRSLEKVGREIGLSREGIRQLLKKGAKLGLYEYKKLNATVLANVPNEKLIEDYKKSLHLKEVAKINNISMTQLYKLLAFYHISREKLDAIRTDGRKLACIRQYNLIVRTLGHHPSTAELQKTHEGHYLSSKIIQLWGSIHIFRQEMKIKFSPRYGGHSLGPHPVKPSPRALPEGWHVRPNRVKKT